MKTIQEVLGFCNKFTFNSHYNIEKVRELNHVRDCVNCVLSKFDFRSEDETLRVLGVVDGIAIMITDRNVENISVETNNLRIGLLQLLCVEKVFAPEAKYKYMKVDIIDGKKVIDIELVKSFQHENWFNELEYYYIF